MFSPISDIPFIATEHMKEVDRKMRDDHIELLQMMENAGRNLEPDKGALSGWYSNR